MNTKLEQLLMKKRQGVPIAIATAYDYPTSRMVRETTIDAVLVGDSVGTT